MPPTMEGDLEPVVRLLAENRWPWRLHATYDETITRALDVFEKVNRDVPLEGLHWFFDHCETITDRNIDASRRSAAASPCSTGWRIQGEYFVERYGARAAERTPPIARCSRWASPSVPAPTRPASPATTLGSRSSWLVTGKTLGGLRLYPQRNLLDRESALRLWTQANTWFSTEEGKKGQIKAGQLADLVVLDRDYFTVPEDEIQDIECVLTLLGGKPVHGTGDYAGLAPPLPPAMPDWSPVRTFGGYQRRAGMDGRKYAFAAACGCASACGVHGHAHASALAATVPVRDEGSFWGALGCSCWAF